MATNFSGATTYSVRYDDGTEEDGLSLRALKPNTRRVVFESDELIVVDGSKIEINHVGYAQNAQPFALTNVTADEYLKRIAGDEYQKQAGLPTPYVPVLADAVAEPEVMEAVV